MTHYIVQEVSREARERGEKGKIIGNLALPDEQVTPPARTEAARKAAEPEKHDPAEEEDDIPF